MTFKTIKRSQNEINAVLVISSQRLCRLNLIDT